ncbi:hypothetical protein, partial [Avibacterium paragallinarum]|uniref:hypothetical protein n=1 Tax=Avibacterium paragallinarum TaxID=728 RepID=UPI00188F8A91
MSVPQKQNDQTQQVRLNELEMKVAFLETLNRSLVRALVRSPTLDDFLDVFEQETVHASDAISETSLEVAEIFDRYLAGVLGE